MDTLDALKSLGLELPSPAYIAGVILFGIVGIVAWVYGRRIKRQSTRWLGLALMFYPYVVWQTWLLYGVGVALCVWIWMDLRRA
ncbi:MAG: hypothetical protein JSR59_24865 [Proteobacteria bacterium]|nr:hypothetical protein [Pseudomonadota bacterium]